MQHPKLITKRLELRMIRPADAAFILEAEHQKAEIGFWLLPAYWGKGYVPEAARAVLQYAFHEMHLNRIEAIVEGGNAASEKVLQKLGFTCEGRLREREIKNGRFIDLIYYSLLKREL